MLTDDEDLIGLPVKRGPGRPPLPETTAAREKAANILEGLVNARRDREAGVETPHTTVADVYQGVSVSWLSQVFGIDPGTVKKRLKDCPPLHRKKTGFVYELRVAAQYLVAPKVDVEAYMRTAKASELPTHLQEAYWSAKRKQQQYETDAGHLWHDTQVMEVFGDVFLTIKQTMQLWPDSVERATGLSDVQRQMLIRMCDSLQQDIHTKLKQMPNLKSTPSSLKTGAAPLEPEPDDDYSQLI